MVNNTNIIELISSYLEKSHRKISDFDIYDSNLSYKTFKETQKLIGIKFYNPKSLKKDLPCRLLMDYVIIPADMWVIKTPFNLIYNQNTKRYEPCLVVLVAALEIKGKVYPIDFCFWKSENMFTNPEEYQTKSELAEELLDKLIRTYNIDRVIFDAGFCVPKLLKMLDDISIKYICRYPKSRKIIYKNKASKVENVFKSVPSAGYYYYNKNGYLNFTFAKYADHNVQIVVVANTKEKLVKKDFYCLLTNDLDLKYPTVLKTYKKRGKIEDLFKKLKTYLGMTVCNRHHEDYIIDRINLAFTGFVILQDYSSKSKQTFHASLKKIKASNHYETKVIVEKSFLNWFVTHENNAFEDFEVA